MSYMTSVKNVIASLNAFKLLSMYTQVSGQ